MARPALRGVREDTPEDVFRAVLRHAVRALESQSIDYVLVGGVGSAVFGRPRWTRDIDIQVTPTDADRALDTLGAAGFDTQRTNPHWIYKATMEDVVVDLIFRTVGDIYLDDEMLSRAVRSEFQGVSVNVASPEDQIVIKAIANDEQSSRHWNDALALITSCELDWDYLAGRASRGARRVLSLLIYAQSCDLVVPERAVQRLYDQIYLADKDAS